MSHFVTVPSGLWHSERSSGATRDVCTPWIALRVSEVFQDDQLGVTPTWVSIDPKKIYWYDPIEFRDYRVYTVKSLI